MNLFKYIKFGFLIGILNLSGCAMTPEIKSKAERHLEGDCLYIFTRGFEYGYYLSSSLSNNLPGILQPRAVFAFAKDSSNRYACAIKNNRQGTDAMATWEELEREALVRCEENRKKHGVQSTC